MKLFTKYSRINLLVMVIVFLLSAISTNWLVDYVLITELDGDLAGSEQRLRAYVATTHQLPSAPPLDESRISYQLTNTPIDSSLFSSTTLYSGREKKMHNFRQIVFTLSDSGRTYEVTIAKPLDGLHHVSNGIIKVCLATILAAILALLLINRLLLRRLWQPFYDALHAIRHLKLGSSSELRFPVTTTDEFSFLNESLGIAAKKAEQDYLLLKEFTENASHELQTPLSIIRSKLEILIQDEDLSLKQSDLINSTFASIKKLSRLNQSLLLLTRIGNKQFTQTEAIDLKEKIENKIADFRELWQANDITADSQLRETIITANPDLIEILLNNVFGNAGNHNIPGGSISIRLGPGHFSVSNTSSATALDPDRIFTRFYKGEQHTGNNGLGLAIIKEICDTAAITPSYTWLSGRHSFTFTW